MSATAAARHADFQALEFDYRASPDQRAYRRVLKEPVERTEWRHERSEVP